MLYSTVYPCANSRRQITQYTVVKSLNKQEYKHISSKKSRSLFVVTGSKSFLQGPVTPYTWKWTAVVYSNRVRFNYEQVSSVTWRTRVPFAYTTTRQPAGRLALSRHINLSLMTLLFRCATSVRQPIPSHLDGKLPVGPIHLPGRLSRRQLLPLCCCRCHWHFVHVRDFFEHFRTFLSLKPNQPSVALLGSSDCNVVCRWIERWTKLSE